MILGLLASAAFAGVLADGFHGAAFGPASQLHRPSPNCTANPGPGIRWACPIKIGGAGLTAYYMVSRRRFIGVLASGTVDPAQESLVHGALSASWGPSTAMYSIPGSPVVWADGENTGYLQYDQETSELTIGVFSVEEAHRAGVVAP